MHLFHEQAHKKERQTENIQTTKNSTARQHKNEHKNNVKIQSN